MIGNLICEKEIKATDEAILFNVEDFSKGAYIVTVENRSQKTSLKFLKSKI